MNKSLVAIILATFYILHSTFSVAQAVGVSVKPSELSVKAAVNEEMSVRLRIKNPSNEVALFQVYPEEFDAMITSIPAKMTLQAAEERDVVIRIKSQKEGLFDTKLAVVARPLDDPTFGIASGVKVPLHITVTKDTSGFALISNYVTNGSPWILAMFLLAAILYAVSLRRKLATAHAKIKK